VRPLPTRSFTELKRTHFDREAFRAEVGQHPVPARLARNRGAASDYSPLHCHCERSEAISARLALTRSRLLRRPSAPRNDIAPIFSETGVSAALILHQNSQRFTRLYSAGGSAGPRRERELLDVEHLETYTFLSGNVFFTSLR
jgi:hypothetical protein